MMELRSTKIPLPREHGQDPESQTREQDNFVAEADINCKILVHFKMAYITHLIYKQRTPFLFQLFITHNKNPPYHIIPNTSNSFHHKAKSITIPLCPAHNPATHFARQQNYMCRATVQKTDAAETKKVQKHS